MTSITKNTVKEHITDALIADLSTTVAKLQKDCGIMEDNINRLFQLIGKQEEQKVDSPNTDLESSKKSKNITEWLINIYETGNVPNEVVKILRKGMGVTMDAYKKTHKKEIDAKEGKEIKVLIGLIMRDLNNTSTMTELIDLYTSINKETSNETENSGSESETDNESKKSPTPTPIQTKKAPTKKSVTIKKSVKTINKSSSESESEISEDEKPTPKKITTMKTPVKTAAVKTSVKKPTAVKTAAKKPTAVKKVMSSSSESSDSE